MYSDIFSFAPTCCLLYIEKDRAEAEDPYTSLKNLPYSPIDPTIWAGGPSLLSLEFHMKRSPFEGPEGIPRVSSLASTAFHLLSGIYCMPTHLASHLKEVCALCFLESPKLTARIFIIVLT